MPTDNSVHWKPLRDPHYVLASLHAAEYQLIFVEQAVLVRVQDGVRTALSQGRRALGLLLGERYLSPAAASYMVIESLAEDSRGVARDDAALAAAVSNLLERRSGGWSGNVLGWYTSERVPPSRVPDQLAAIHAASFERASETLLVLAEGKNAGAFFMRDASDLQWYCAPFYEVGAPDRVKDGRKTTCISWPEYMTTDLVVQLPITHRTSSEARVREPEPPPKSPTSLSPPRIDRPDESRSTAPPRVIDDSIDTSVVDPPDRFLELAQAEGFSVAAKFEASISGNDEVIWVLYEPYSGLLLTVVADRSRILDASLHYNIHTGDADVLNSAFPEDRDLESGTVYLREFCIDELRARCRRLRATNRLEREWKVAPTLSLLTPREWELGSAVGLSYNEPSSLETLSRHRIESLPDPVRRQYRLTPHRNPGEAPGEKQGAG